LGNSPCRLGGGATPEVQRGPGLRRQPRLALAPGPGPPGLRCPVAGPTGSWHGTVGGGVKRNGGACGARQGRQGPGRKWSIIRNPVLMRLYGRGLLRAQAWGSSTTNLATHLKFCASRQWGPAPHAIVVWDGCGIGGAGGPGRGSSASTRRQRMQPSAVRRARATTEKGGTDEPQLHYLSPPRGNELMFTPPSKPPVSVRHSARDPPSQVVMARAGDGGHEADAHEAIGTREHHPRRRPRRVPARRHTSKD